MSPAGEARVTAVCVVHEVRPGYFHDTAIDKRPLPGTVQIGELGPEGDVHIDHGHGGLDAAVYVYAEEDAVHFAEVLGHDVPPGYFGENVRTTGLDVTGARLGERWRMGEVLLEVRKPRTPCQNLSQRVGVEGFHLVFNRTGRVGAMCRVLEPGALGSGDPVLVEHVPDHDVSIGTFVTGMTADQARRLLDSGTPLTDPARAKARRVVDRHSTV
jgi:MOSC domain-containing protein YiiM